jgi:flagellar biosynthetic protein FliO
MLPPALAIFVVLALLFGLLWLARRKGLAALSLGYSAGRGGNLAIRQMRVIERLPLSGPHSLHLVACGGRWLVVAASPSGCRTIADLAEPSSEALAAAGGAR